MPIFHTFKQSVLELGRGEAKTKARPLTVDGETLDRSAAGLDARVSERSVLFWLLSDRALFLVVGSSERDDAYRVPYECLTGISLDFDENAEFLPWYIRLGVAPEGEGQVTRLEPGSVPGQPLSPPPPVVLDDAGRAKFARGELAPLSGFGSFPRRFRDALRRRLDLAGVDLSITGEEAADRSALTAKLRRTDEPS